MPKINQRIVIVGTGFAGLAMAVALKKAGQHDFILLEAADEVGGTWRDNTYPGAACDVPSPVYSFSFEPNPHWSSKFSPQKEIFSYLQHCATKYGLRPHIRFQSRVESSHFAEETGLWTVNIAGQDPILCRYLVLCTGGLSRPSYPKIPGLESFQGALFHSARWNHQFSLSGARVGVIGTGASAIQIVPAIAPSVAKLSLFQRTPAWILPKSERPFKSFERKLLAWMPGYHFILRKMLYWQFELRAIGLLKPSLMRIPQKEAVDLIHREVRDPQLQKRLTPHYTMGCKRVLLSNDFYPSLNRSNVELVSDSIERIVPGGIVTKDGREHRLDALICATGFQVAEASAPFPVFGLGGQELGETWKDGAEGYLGVSISGYPNLFTIVGPNSGLGHNSIVFMIEAQARYIQKALVKMQKDRMKYLDLKKGVQDAYNQDLSRRFEGTVWTNGHCVSWYQTPSGKNTTIFPGFSFQLRWRARKFNAADYQAVFLENQGEVPSLRQKVSARIG